MRDQLKAELAKIVGAVAVTSPDSFTFAGRPFSAAAHQQQHQQQQQAAGFAQQNPLATLLEQVFYQYCYSRTFDGQLRDETAQPPSPDSNLTPALSEANATRERWDTGWQVYQLLPSGQILAHKQGRTRALWPGEFLSLDAPGMQPRPGQNISVFFMRETTTMQPGFYFAFGEAQGDEQEGFSLVRFYWNLRAEGAAPLMRAVTRRLNRFQVPFRFKCLANGAFYHRQDSAVLYVNKRFYRVTSWLLADAHAELSAHLRPETPLFTKRLADGLGLAEEPYTGESFGMQRCRILAEGVLSAEARALKDNAARLEEVEQHFHRYGLTLERPYLNPGSVDQYDFTLAREAA